MVPGGSVVLTDVRCVATSSFAGRVVRDNKRETDERKEYHKCIVGQETRKEMEELKNVVRE